MISTDCLTKYFASKHFLYLWTSLETEVNFNKFKKKQT